MKYIICLFFAISALNLQSQTTLAWLQKKVVPISSTNQYTDNSQDYEPLKKILAGKEIVLLGEEDHVFATTFESKTKLIQFLHKEMGFTVLAFEYDLYALANSYQKAVKENNPSILQNGIYPFWGKVKSTESLFPYILSATKNQKLPLKVIGFDCQTMPQFSLADSINAYLLQNKSPILRYDYYPKFAETFKKTYSNPYQTNLTQADKLLLFNVFDDILFEMELFSPKTQRLHLLMQSLVNFRNNLNNIWLDAPVSYHILGQTPPADSVYGFVGARQSMGSLNRRDKLMAENIRWLKDTFYPNEKIIIWAASEHTMYNRHLAKFHNMLVDSSFLFNSRFTFGAQHKNMGTYLQEYYGEKIYNLGFTTLGGQINYDRSGNSNYLISLFSAENSLEALFSQLSTKNGILDFSDKVPSEIKDKNLFHNFIGGQPNITGDITQFFDGIYFTGEMKPLEFLKK